MASGDGGEGDGGTAAGGAADIIGGGGGGDAAAAAAGGAEGAGGAAAGADAAGGGDGSWFEKLSADADGDKPSNRDWAQSKGFKDVDALVKSARDTEAAYRGNGAVKVPGEGAKPEEVAAFHRAIGVPEKAEGYEFKGPDGVKLDDAAIGAMRESALKHGTPAGAFSGLLGDFIKLQLDQQAAANTAIDGQAQEWVKQQGGNLDAQTAHINTACKALGLKQDDMQWFRTMPGGPGRALDLLAKLGSGMAEDVLITGGKGRFGVSPAEAQAEIEKLRVDSEFQKKVMVKGSPERLRWDRLVAASAEGAAAKEAA